MNKLGLRVLVLAALFAALFSGLLLLAPLALAAEGPHFCYEGDCGPANWGQLSPDWATCATGKEQSPVDIPASAPLNTAGLKLDYRPSTLNIVDNGHTVQANFQPGSMLLLDGKLYQLQQVHPHAQSEHRLAGKALPAEAHFVHQAVDSSKAVLGVFLTPGAENAAWAPFFANLPSAEGPAATIPGASLDPAQMLPARQSYYRYDGSLTTPPCTEGVKWVVQSTPVEVSEAQLAAFTQLYNDNFRPVQPLNGRTFLNASSAAPGALPATGGGLAPVALAMTCLGGASLLAAGVALRGRGKTP